MSLELISTKSGPFELYCHCRHFFGIVGYGVCLITPPTVSVDLFETLHTRCEHNENVHVDF